MRRRDQCDPLPGLRETLERRQEQEQLADARHVGQEAELTSLA